MATVLWSVGASTTSLAGIRARWPASVLPLCVTHYRQGSRRATRAPPFARATVLARELNSRHPQGRRVLDPLLFGGATLVGFARIYERQHWPSDVVAGAALGTITGFETVAHARRDRSPIWGALLSHFAVERARQGTTFGWVALGLAVRRARRAVRGPTVSFRRIDNAIYYWLDDDNRFYRDFTGSGQTVNVSHPVVRDLVLDALRYTEHRGVESYRELDPFPLLDMSRILDICPVHRYVDSHEEFERVARANSPASACLGADGSRAGHCR